MRLLIYTPVYPPHVGGVETIVHSLATGLATLKTATGDPEFTVELVTATPAGDFDDTSLPFRIYRQPGIKELWHLIRNSDVFHVACAAMLPMILGYIAGKPVVVEHHGFQLICPTGQLLQEPIGQPCPGHFQAGRYGECLRCRTDQNWKNSWKQWFSTWVRRAICPRVFANIMPTEYLGELLKLRNSVTIVHGIELTGIAPATDAFHQEPPVILYQGRLVNTKGIRVLIDAASILHRRGRDFELRVIGNGPEREALKHLVAELGISDKVRFLGRLDDAALPEAMRGVHIVAMPSLAGEVFGLVLAENMARGMAVVASQIGALAEVAGDAGLVFPTGDAEALADQLEKLLINPALVSELGHRARQRVERVFDRTQMVANHAALYHEALAASR